MKEKWQKNGLGVESSFCRPWGGPARRKILRRKVLEQRAAMGRGSLMIRLQLAQLSLRNTICRGLPWMASSRIAFPKLVATCDLYLRVCS